MKLLAVLSLVLAFQSITFAQEPEWFQKVKQLRLLSSTYEDAVRILGTPSDGTSERELSEYFDLKEGRVFVAFENGKCVISSLSGKPTGWLVPAWTVVTVGFEPAVPMTKKDLPFKIKGFRKYESSDVRGAFSYENERDGLSFFVKRNGNIEDVSFNPPSSMDHLLCK